MLSSIQQIVASKNDQIQEWLASQWKGLHPQIYLSCDIRHSGFKIGVIDTNIFPAGFNNLCKIFSHDTSLAFREYLNTYFLNHHRILLFAEDHTRNKFYLKNLFRLKHLIEKAGRQVKIGVVGASLNEPVLNIELEEGRLTLTKITQSEGRILCGDFIPDLIISNNDFSSGVPASLTNINQPIIPNVKLGWQDRKKSHHFTILTKIIQAFSDQFHIDPWFLTPYTETVTHINFSDTNSLDHLSKQVDQLLSQIQSKYSEYQIKETPYVYIKNNAGTYGMGLIPVYSGDEVMVLNRRRRNKLLSAKGDVSSTEFIIQEGIPTIDHYSEYPLEPVMYVVGKKNVGGFFRIHEEKSPHESLNAPGMTFACLCLHKLDEPHEKYFIDCKAKESVVHLSQLLAQMASLAVAKEAL